MFTIRLLKKIFRSSYLHLLKSNLLQLPLVKYSPVTFFGNARDPSVDHTSLLFESRPFPQELVMKSEIVVR